MRVLLLFGNCAVGGVQLMHVDLHREFTRRGVDVEFFWFARGDLAGHLPAGSRSHFGDLDSLLTLLERSPFDVLHCSVWDLNLGVDAAKAVPQPPRVVATVHAQACPGWWSGNCDALTGCSGAMSRKQQRLTDLRVQTVLNGVDTELFRPGGKAAGPPIVAWVGRAADTRQKRIERLAGISGSLVASGARVWVATADPLSRVEGERTRRLLQENCERWQRVERDRMPSFYRDVANSGGLLLMTSDYEGFGLALAEAQACGCPVVAPRIEGVTECVSEQHGGVLYPAGSPPERLAELLTGLLRCPTALRDRGRSLVDHARERLSLSRTASEYLAIYEQQPESRGVLASGGALTRMVVATQRYRGGWRAKRRRAAAYLRAAGRLRGDGHSAAAEKLQTKSVRAWL